MALSRHQKAVAPATKICIRDTRFTETVNNIVISDVGAPIPTRPKNRIDLQDVLVLCALVCLEWGVAAIYVPAALILAGRIVSWVRCTNSTSKGPRVET